MEFLHNDHDEQLLTLHDCRANRAELRDGVLSFWFEEGVWVTQSHPENPTGKTVRTGPARVDYMLRETDGDDVSVPPAHTPALRNRKNRGFIDGLERHSPGCAVFHGESACIFGGFFV